jgi:hypothetical protein
MRESKILLGKMVCSSFKWDLSVFAVNIEFFHGDEMGAFAMVM